MKDFKILGFVALYTAGIFYGTYCSVNRVPCIGKIKWS